MTTAPPRPDGPGELDQQLVDIDSVRPDPDNARKHGKRNLDTIEASLREFGQRRAIIVTPAGIIAAGNGTHEVARDRLGWRQIWISTFPDEDIERARAYAIVDNRSAELAEWDEATLLDGLQAVGAAGFETATLGFSGQDLKRLEPSKAEVADDPIPAAPKRSKTRRGDTWILGEHRLYCGDATVADDVRALVGRRKPALYFTDPPYGVDYEAASGKHEHIDGDELRRDDLARMLAAAFKLAAKHTADAAAFYIWHATATRDEYSTALKAAGLEELQYLIWAKPSAALGHDDYQWAHEPCFYAGKAGQRPAWHGDRAQQTVWRVAAVAGDDLAVVLGPGVLITDGNGLQLFCAEKAPKRKTRHIRLEPDTTITLQPTVGNTTVWEVGRDRGVDHPTPKPVELARRAIENSTRPGDTVLDTFAGAGSTLIAAEHTGRRALVMERKPSYCDVIVERWKALTDGAPERQRP